MSEVEKFPAWKQAVDEFLSAGFAEGEVIKREWFEDALGLKRPRLASHEDWQRFSVAFVAGFERLKDALLEHHIHLENVFGQGYRIVPPSEQVETIAKRGKHDVAKSIRRQVKALHSVDLMQLTEAQRDEHAKQLQRAGMVRAFTRMSDSKLQAALAYKPPSRPKLVELADGEG